MMGWVGTLEQVGAEQICSVMNPYIQLPGCSIIYGSKYPVQAGDDYLLSMSGHVCTSSAIQSQLRPAQASMQITQFLVGASQVHIIVHDPLLPFLETQSRADNNIHLMSANVPHGDHFRPEPEDRSSRRCKDVEDILWSQKYDNHSLTTRKGWGQSIPPGFVRTWEASLSKDTRAA